MDAPRLLMNCRRIKPLLSVLALLSLLTLQSCTTTAPDITSLNAQQILQQLATAYASADSYLDSGIVEEVVQNREMTITMERPFSIAFVRPDKFRFQFTDPQGLKLDSGRNSNIAIVWRDGDDIRSWWDLSPDVQQHSSLAIALTGPAGISRSSALITPSLLMPQELGAALLSDMPNAVRLEDMPCGALHCFRVQGDFGDGSPVVWIDQDQYLIRQVENSFTVRGNRYFVTLNFEPQINVAVSVEALEFNPPE